ncbi:hypothetical protein B5728_01785 [Mammaliicoccus sciuri]|nr:hypothetical protein B5728_01785 [Mammaliicoccus sciuri]
MKRQGRNRDYPRIEKILDDGTIIAYDKFNQLNTDLNINTLTDHQQHEVFGGILIRPQRRTNDYNERDYRREQYQQQEIESSKRKNKWLMVLLFIVAIALVAFIVKACTGPTIRNKRLTLNHSRNKRIQTIPKWSNKK